MQLFGPVDSGVRGDRSSAGPARAVDDDDFVALTHASGAVAPVDERRSPAQLGPRMRVLGDRAAYTKYGLDGQEAALGAGPAAR